MRRVTELTGKKPPGGRPKRGVSGAGRAKSHAPFVPPGQPPSSDRAPDLEPTDIYSALERDQAAPPWPGAGGPSSTGPLQRVDIQPLTLVRDIHCFVTRALGCRAPALAGAHLAESRPTVIGREMDGLFDRIRAGVPRDYSHHSEHVRLFLDTYRRFGLDGGEGDAELIGRINSGSSSKWSMHESFLQELRAKSKERIDRKRFAINADTEKHIQAAKNDPSRARYWEQRKRRRARAYKNNRASSTLIKDIFRREQSVYVVRLDVGIMPDLFSTFLGPMKQSKKEKKQYEQAAVSSMSKMWFSHFETPLERFKGMLQSIFRAINKGVGPLGGVVGRIGRLMWSPTRGVYCHLIIFYRDQANDTYKDVAQKVGDYWALSVTNGIGVYAIPDEGSSIYVKAPVGRISGSDVGRVQELLGSVCYLSAIDEYFSLPSEVVSPGEDVFFYSELQTLKPVVRPSEKRKPGRPKKGESFDQMNL